MRNRLSKSGLQLEFEDIAKSLNLRLAALNLYYSPANPRYLALFATYTPDDLDSEKQYELSELENDACLSLLAAIEAAFRLDYAIRNELRLKRKDKLNLLLRNLYGLYKFRISLEDGILQAWFDTMPQFQSLISALRGAFKYRHWLAHGRYWTLKVGRDYDFDNLYALAIQVQTMGLLRQDS